MRSSPRRFWYSAGQKLHARRVSGFAHQFGKPEPHVIDQFHHPEHADILILSNVQKDGKPTGLADAGTYFHTDYSYLDVPARAPCCIRSRCRRRAATRCSRTSTPPTTICLHTIKKRIERLVALHHYGNRDDQDKSSRTVASVLTEEQEGKMAWVGTRWRASIPLPGAPRSMRFRAARSASKACPTTRR